jgi:hypothetical protein
MIELFKDQVREEDKDGWRWYRGEDQKARISVTKVLDGMKPERLQNWIAKTSYEEQTKRKTESATLGTKIHSAIENILRGDYAIEAFAKDEEFEDIRWASEEFLQWKAEKRSFELQAVEGAVASDLGYAGTYDFIATVPYNGSEARKQSTVLFDIKTGRTSITAGYQLAAYRHAWEKAGVQLDGMAVLNISVRDRKVQQFDYTHYDFCLQRFLGIFEGWKGLNYKKLDAMKYEWLHQYSPSVVFNKEGKRRES